MNENSSHSTKLRHTLEACPAGIEGWRAFEDAATEILCHLFVPPLVTPHTQARSYSGIDRRDAIFANRVTDTSKSWGLLRHDLNAKMVLVEFKNYLSEEIGKEETDQTRNYLKQAFGRLAILCCNKVPNHAAHIRRNSVYSEEGKVILFLLPDDLYEMLDMKERGEDPADFIADAVERFYIQHE